MSYQGRVLAGGSPYKGTGYFKFTIVNAAASSSASSEPSFAVPVTVNNGLFTMLLGDTTLTGMTQPLSATVFATAVAFDDANMWMPLYRLYAAE